MSREEFKQALNQLVIQYLNNEITKGQFHAAIDKLDKTRP